MEWTRFFLFLKGQIKIMYYIEIQAFSQNIVSSLAKQEYKKYIKGKLDVLDFPDIEPKDPFYLYFEFGLSVKQDCTNGIKILEDLIADRLGLNDRDMMALFVRKVIVPKSNTYIKFNVFAYEYDLIRAINDEI